MLTRLSKKGLLLATTTATAVLLAVAASGCTDPGTTAPSSGSGGNTPDGGIVGTDYTFHDGGTQTTPSGPRKESDSHSPGGARGDSTGAGPTPPLAPVTGGGMSSSGGGVVGEHPCSTAPCLPPMIPAGQLTAGEWNDLAHWDFFLNMLAQPQTDSTVLWGAAQTRWGLFPSTRIAVNVTSAGAPARNVPVELRDQQGAVLWRAQTNKQGAAQLFAGMFAPVTGPFVIHAGVGSASKDIAVHELPGPLDAVAVNLDGSGTPQDGPLALDLMLMVDTTGSMGDELKYIQSELEDVVSRVKSQFSGQTTVRLSVNFYRDLEDDYVVRAYPFTTDDAAAVQAIAQQDANGGGDMPEAVDHALQVAVNQHEWDQQSSARILLLVLDAPPHEDQGTLLRVREAIADAAARGIQIIPVGASGIDKSTELLLRFLAIATNGSYAFLTNDSGIGNSHLDPSPTIGPFNVEFLNDLLVRVIADRL